MAILSFTLLLLYFCADTRHIYEFNCTSRRKDHPLEQDGAPVQYVHVPKAAGTSIQFYIQIRIAKRFDRPSKKLDRRKHPELCPANDDGWEGGIYWGHCPIVSAHGNPRPMFIVSMRKPVDRWVSNFNYIARNKNHFDHKKQMKEMRKFMKDGVAKEQIFSMMLSTDHPHALALLDRSQWSWMIPMGCPIRNKTSQQVGISLLTKKRKKMAKAILLKNLVRSDLVVTMDQLDTFVLQMIHHLDNGRLLDDTRKLEHTNWSRRREPEQILDYMALKAIMKHPVGARNVSISVILSDLQT